MDRSDAPMASYGSRPQYEREKERLIVEINQGMDMVNRNLVQLNQNLESAISLGSNFSRVASLWSEFGTIISPGMEEEGSGDSNNEDSASADEACTGEAGGANDYEVDDEDNPGYESESQMDEDS
ncbi:hypothetical protein GGF42_006937 [Coemansia sp. RSA 2424]|nr:hypothetical protein GGF42_006937 [Coemansia sp. RSA 2424]